MKVGLIGLGVMGRNHLRVLATLPDAEIVAISDPLMRRATLHSPLRQRPPHTPTPQSY